MRIKTKMILNAYVFLIAAAYMIGTYGYFQDLNDFLFSLLPVVTVP